LTATQTGALTAQPTVNYYNFNVQATLSNGRILTLVRGQLAVISDEP
jgi:hypothetical protein